MIAYLHFYGYVEFQESIHRESKGLLYIIEHILQKHVKTSSLRPSFLKNLLLTSQQYLDMLH